MTVARMQPGEQYLPCPDCGTDAIPASEYTMSFGPGGMTATWTEDDEADCPGCGQHLVATITGDGEEEWIEAQVSEPKKG
jgi:predicted RNA-binding Zn-ribbon protein involved in translation (DUF1610 family)